MITSLFILALGLTPALLSLWILRQANARVEARLRLVMESIGSRGISGLQFSTDHQYVEGLGYIIGDFTCRWNARSSYLRCAINPSGPCESCSSYESRPLPDDTFDPQ